MRDATDDPEIEIPAKPPRNLNDIEPDAPDDGSDDEEIKVQEQEPEAPSYLSSVGLSADSTIIKLARRDPVIASLRDHFSLNASSNLVRFRHRLNAARVYDEGRAQMVLEEEYNEETDTSTITVKTMNDSTSGTTILRISYTVVTALWTGFFFTFCLQVLLFLVLDLAVASGATAVNAELYVGNTIGVFLAMVTFVIAFTEALVIAGYYIIDTWEGHFLAKTFVFKKLSSVAVEWVFFFFFLGCPLVIMCVSLLMRKDNWWEITALAWFMFVLGFYILFAMNVVYFEVRAAWNFCKNRSDCDSDDWRHVLKRCFMLRQIHNYSGTQQDSYLARAAFRTLEDTEVVDKDNIYEKSHQTSWSPWTRLSRSYLSSFFEELPEPQRLYTMDDVSDYRPFLTKTTWSLERIFCRPSKSRYIAVVQGPGALTRTQFRSSFICSIIGTSLIVLIFVSVLVWFELSGVSVFFAFVIASLLAYTSLRNTITVFKLHKDLVGIKSLGKKNSETGSNAEEVESGEKEAPSPISPLPPRTKSERVWAISGQKPSECVFVIQERKRVTQPTERFCYAMFGMEFIFLFLWPAITLFIISWNVAVMFVLVAPISAMRHYINPAVVVEETGNMELVGGKDGKKKWRNQSRLNTIVSSITVGKTKRLWRAILGVAGFAFLAIFLGAVGSNTDPNAEGLTYLPSSYYYPPQSDDMRYATCTLTNIRGGFGDNTLMMDYIAMATLAYTADELTQPALDAWFGEGVAEYRQDIVDEFRSNFDVNNAAVFFKLFSFPEIGLGVISIRGTSNNWDMLADSELWSAAALMQGIRFILPAGEMWTPILDRLVHWINKLQGQALEKVSFYILTTQFANYLKNDPNFTDIQVTGHSLGGGLAMITGAQAGIPAVGVSGPNALISGRSFNPPVTAEQMNQYTFNIVPNRDIVPMLDDKADQFQHIRCQSPSWDFVGCHFSKRSLCEVAYTCGTGQRPAICECHRDYGYPRPEFNSTDGAEDNFDEICGIMGEMDS
ncbi:lipase class 3 [Nitzschia inconspicua]|uniref:Lipase class 3 n=1 Tax=Nitzschia inconspicua TaxID=303405 RepID=A0A9K3Q838_9STRA|nr:lipase class 3 [Nitzschia inconspicua]